VTLEECLFGFGVHTEIPTLSFIVTRSFAACVSWQSDEAATICYDLLTSVLRQNESRWMEGRECNV
jgi:hypothetical protein